MLLCGECYENVYTKGVQTIHHTPLSVFSWHSSHSNIWKTTAKLFLKHPTLPVKVAMNNNYPK
jgi:hypothetical protein